MELEEYRYCAARSGIFGYYFVAGDGKTAWRRAVHLDLGVIRRRCPRRMPLTDARVRVRSIEYSTECRNSGRRLCPDRTNHERRNGIQGFPVTYGNFHVPTMVIYSTPVRRGWSRSERCLPRHRYVCQASLAPPDPHMSDAGQSLHDTVESAQ